MIPMIPDGLTAYVVAMDATQFLMTVAVFLAAVKYLKGK